MLRPSLLRRTSGKNTEDHNSAYPGRAVGPLQLPQGAAPGRPAPFRPAVRKCQEAYRRYRTGLEGGGNRALNRHTFVEGTGIGFTAPDQITDSNNGLDRFSISELFVVQGTANNNFGWYPLVVAPGAITVAFGGVTTEGAGANVILKTVANLFRA